MRLGLLGAFPFLSGCTTTDDHYNTARLEPIILADGGKGFVFASSQAPFIPWGLNYGNNGRLIEDFWDAEWDTIVSDFREMKALGANVVRVHLQFGKFMRSPSVPDEPALQKLQLLIELAERTQLYLDVTGLACYRKGDVPRWYDALEESARWGAQAAFWEAVAQTCASSPSIFCYDLMNEPVAAANPRKAGEWYSGHLLGGLDFIQYINLDPAERKREDVALQWIQRMSAAIRKHDRNRLITVGMLPWVQGWQHLSGFIPARVADEVDFLSVHIYPDAKKPGEAREALRHCNVGKAVVIEETFPLTCSPEQLADFLADSRRIACGWMGHYDGVTIDEYDSAEARGDLTVQQAMWRDWLRLFVEMRPAMLRR